MEQTRTLTWFSADLLNTQEKKFFKGRIEYFKSMNESLMV